MRDDGASESDRRVILITMDMCKVKALTKTLLLSMMILNM